VYCNVNYVPDAGNGPGTYERDHDGVIFRIPANDYTMQRAAWDAQHPDTPFQDQRPDDSELTSQEVYREVMQEQIHNASGGPLACSLWKRARCWVMDAAVTIQLLTLVARATKSKDHRYDMHHFIEHEQQLNISYRNAKAGYSLFRLCVEQLSALEQGLAACDGGRIAKRLKGSADLQRIYMRRALLLHPEGKEFSTH